MVRAPAATALAALLLCGCSFTLGYHECDIDSDCVRLASAAHPTLSCSSEHLCVAGVPEERLCAPLAEAPPDGASVVFGVLAHTTGPQAALDDGRLAAVRVAAGEIRKLNLTPVIGAVVCDLGSDPDQVSRAFLAAVNRYHAAAVVGPTDSASAIAVTPLAVQTQTLVMLGSATAISIRNLVDGNLVWRTAPSDQLQAVALLARMTDYKADNDNLTFDLAYASTLVPAGLEAALIGVLSDGLSLEPSTVTSFDPGADMTPVAAKLAMGMASAAVLLSDDDVPALVKALAAWGSYAHATRFLASSTARVPALLKATSDTATLARVEGTSNALQAGPHTVAFRANFGTLFGADPSLTPGAGSTYDAYYAAAAAVGAVPAGQAITGPALATAMPRINNVHAGNYVSVGTVDFARAWQLLASGEDINLNGVSGDIDFDPMTGDVVTAPFDIWKISTAKSPPDFLVVSTVVPNPQ